MKTHSCPYCKRRHGTARKTAANHARRLISDIKGIAEAPEPLLLRSPSRQGGSNTSPRARRTTPAHEHELRQRFSERGWKRAKRPAHCEEM
ncbi:unnamed protein product [Gadus morhua 'NCC']